MEKSIIKTAKTVQDAIKLALVELDISEDLAVVEVLEEANPGGFLGIGKKDAVVKVSIMNEADNVAMGSRASDSLFEEEVQFSHSQVEDIEEVYYGDEVDYAESEEITEAEEQAVNFVAEILSGIGIHGQLNSYTEKGIISINVEGSDCGVAIGHHGETLDAITYLTSLVANKYSEEHVRVFLDIGGYRQRREKLLISMAEKAAARTIRISRPTYMEPMNPADRRIVHTALQENSEVSTGSEGVEPYRKVVVYPVRHN